jgi:TRAP-type mannitol/chloroaromatic compound transport system substrate-binding protein
MNSENEKSGQNGLSQGAGKRTRRSFIKGATGIALTTGLGISCNSADDEKSLDKNVNINFNRNFYWKMLTTWPPNFPILGEGCEVFAKWVNEMSGGRMEIRVFGGGEIVPALETFDAVSNGIAELGNGSPYYWAGKIPAAQIFAAVPFGMNAQGLNAWITHGGGQKLWEDLYAPFNLIPVLSGNTGVQMGGWFNKKIETKEDLQGLKMRIPGLGGKVFSKSGGTSVLVAGGEIFTNLERGVIDATEWIGPYHDYLMGFHKIARYYYYPGWHETGTAFETMINTKKYNALPSDLKAIIRRGLEMMNSWILSAFDSRNAIYLEKIKSEGQNDILPFPLPVIEHFRMNARDILEEMSSADESFGKVYAAYAKFRKQLKGWTELSEKAYFTSLYER